MGGLLALKARKLLTIHLQDRYIKPKSMYTLVMNHEQIDNPYVDCIPNVFVCVCVTRTC
jgi:ABC-type uncharacterized transport system fused permease/ATPase subunit